MSSVADEIKSKLDIVAVLSDYIKLKKSGSSFMAVCPFHHEKTPSFHVSPDKQAWYCFGCGEGGDIFGFVMRLDGLEFGEALRFLAKKAGVVLRREDARADAERSRLIEANRWAAKFFHEVLLRSPIADAARAYMRERGLRDETVDDFELGYAPDSWDATRSFLRKKGFGDDLLARAGLVSRREGGGYFDRFRGRLMFPIRDVHGHVAGFTGRILPKAGGGEQKEAKYVNTSQTPLYDKGRLLYGLDRARQEIKKKGAAVVVEGNMDLIASHQAGITNVVASSGTAFSADQLALLKRYADRLALSFDADDAGERAARRSIDAAVSYGFAVRIVRLPVGAGKDPDECIRKDPELWRQAIAEAIPFMDWYIELAKARTDFADPDAKRSAGDSLLREVAKLTDPVEQSHWIRVLSELFRTPETMLFEKLRMLQREAERPAAERPTAAQQPPSALTRAKRDAWTVVSEHALGMLLSWPNLFEQAISAITPDLFEPQFRELYRNFVLFYNEHRTIGAKPTANDVEFKRFGSAEAGQKAIALQFLAEKEYASFSSDERRGTADRLVDQLKKQYLNHQQRELAEAMAFAEKKGDAVRISEIQDKINELIF